jgi:hypothetical protein
MAYAKAKLPSPLSLAEMNARLLKATSPRNQRAKPEARQKAIEFIVTHPDAGQRKIAAAAGVSRPLIQRWINDDAKFAAEVDKLGVKKHGRKWVRLLNQVGKRASVATGRR